MIRRQLWASLSIAFLALVACGTNTPAPSGTGGTVLQTLTPYAISPDWIQWNKASCSFKPASTHPSSWSGTIRTYGSKWTFGFATQSTTLASILTDLDNKLQASATAANVNLILGNNDTGGANQNTAPITEAQRIALAHPAVFGSFNIFETLNDQVLKPFKDNCTPVIQIQGTAPGTAFVGTDPKFGPTLAGNYLADYATKQGWAANSVTLVSGEQPGLSDSLQQLWKACDAAVQAKLPGVTTTSLNVFPSGVGGGPTAGAQIAFTDFLTAHPNAHHILVCVPADLFAIGMANAAVKANRTKDVAIVGELATKEGRALIAQGGTPLIASVDQGFADLGVYTLALAMDLKDGKPIPAVTTTAAKVIDSTNLSS